MFEILVDDLYVIATHSIVQPYLLGLVNVSNIEHVLEGCNHSSTRHIVIYNLKCHQGHKKLGGWFNWTCPLKMYNQFQHSFIM